MRIAVIGTPRSGNVWVRSTLSMALGLRPFAEHHWTDFPDSPPDDSIIGIHWYRDRHFQTYLANNRFRVIALARHPLDVMLSVLAFSRHEPAIYRWLGGDCSIPRNMHLLNPTDSVFLDWTTSSGAENLLAVTFQWWNDPDSIKVKYEDLIVSPSAMFNWLIKQVGVSSSDIERSLEENNFSRFKGLPNRHGWQGVSGLFRTLYTSETAEKIHRRHWQVFDRLGYDSSVDPATTPDSIREAWARLA